MKTKYKNMLRTLAPFPLFVLLMFWLEGCSRVTGKAGPDGKIMEISYLLGAAVGVALKTGGGEP